MFRKKDLNKKNWVKLFPAPQSWTQKSFKNESMVNEHGSVQKKVFVVDEDSSDIEKKVLDPRVINLQAVLESGVTLNPGMVSSTFNLTDPADLESRKSQLGAKMYSYLLENQDAIKEFINPQTTEKL